MVGLPIVHSRIRLFRVEILVLVCMSAISKVLVLDIWEYHNIVIADHTTIHLVFPSPLCFLGGTHKCLCQIGIENGSPALFPILVRLH